jgi:hypothetical protein
LSLYEKTYLENTFLTTLHLLLLNCDMVTTIMYSYYVEIILLDVKLDKDIYLYNNGLIELLWEKVQLWQIKLLEINKTNPELLKLSYVLHLFEFEDRSIDMSAHYFVNFFSYNLLKLFSLEKKKKTMMKHERL